ncbi:sialidase family protein [Catalinimonas alkaloidigena]|uniref:sialidase family protein n=1 Tax=Catalinimonas alkaloidigena TaxID=1075417 RepID=UPI001FDFCA7B|nr:sialidase family protein [Catalinimonas alkaloidigena]
MAALAQDNPWRAGIVTDEFIYTEAPFPSCHASTLAETKEGIVAAWFGGTYERHPDVGIWVSRLVKGKWTKPVEVANGVITPNFRMPTWNPVLFQIPNGDLMLFYKIGPDPRHMQGYFRTSADAGKTWSEQKRMPDGFSGPVKNKPVLLDDGTLLCGSSTEIDGWMVHFERTRDFGKTWEKSGPINDTRDYEVIQPSILQHGNGVLQILCRSQNAVVAESWSYDNGKTWTLMQPSGLPNNNSGTDAVTLADGRHVIVYNHVKTAINASRGHRTPLNVAISNDGKQWDAALILEDSQIKEYSYPSVIQTSDGMVHVTYTWRRERIKHVAFDPNRLKTKPIVDEKWPQ